MAKEKETSRADDLIGMLGSASKSARRQQSENKTEAEPRQSETTAPVRKAGRPRRGEMRFEDEKSARTSLVLDRDLFEKIRYIAEFNGLNIKDVVNASFRNYISKYEEKHGPISSRESKISADELI